MKKPVKRATLLEHVLSDFLKVEDILLQVELKDALQPLTAKEKQLYRVMKQCLHELVRDLTKDVAQATPGGLKKLANQNGGIHVRLQIRRTG